MMKEKKNEGTLSSLENIVTTSASLACISSNQIRITSADETN
jgi:hypothetical protein